jgi:hypothetical protein
MQDTIELLAAIGRDASLRHASADELVPLLERARASAAFMAAVAAGDSALLSAELGLGLNQSPQIANAPGHEEDEPDSDGDDPVSPSSGPAPDRRAQRKP